jgi:hypothetical protein
MVSTDTPAIQKQNNSYISANTEESRMPKSRRLLEPRRTEISSSLIITNKYSNFPLQAFSVLFADHDYQPAPTPVPCLDTALDITLSIAPSALGGHQRVSGEYGNYS